MNRILRRDEGLTTAELIVAMAIMAVLGVMTLTVILGLNKASDAAIERSENATTARTALDSWNSLLAVRESPERDESAAPSIASISESSIEFYASIDNRSTSDDETTPPTLVEIVPEGNGLAEFRYAPGETENEVSRRLLVTHGSLDVRAYRADGRRVQLPSSSDDELADDELTDAERAAIDRVAIKITVRDGDHTYTYGGGDVVPTPTQ